jgi:hypothetical protein
MTNPELDLLFKELPVEHALFDPIGEAWAINELTVNEEDDDESPSTSFDVPATSDPQARE